MKAIMALLSVSSVASAGILLLNRNAGFRNAAEGDCDSQASFSVESDEADRNRAQVDEGACITLFPRHPDVLIVRLSAALLL